MEGRQPEATKTNLSGFSKKNDTTHAFGTGDPRWGLSDSPSCKTVSHLVPMNTVFLPEGLRIVVVILRHFSDNGG
jgi:hypothetical protein